MTEGAKLILRYVKLTIEPGAVFEEYCSLIWTGNFGHFLSDFPRRPHLLKLSGVNIAQR